MWRASCQPGALLRALGAAGAASSSASRAAATSSSATAAAAVAAAASGGATSASAAATLQDMLKARRLSLPAGAAAGLIGSVAGSGGAAVVVPLVSPACPSIPQRVLAGTSLAAVLATASISTATFAAHGHCEPSASLLLTLPALALAPLGARYTNKLNCNAIKRALGYFLLVAAPLVPLKAYLFSSRAEEQQAAAAAAVEAALQQQDEGSAPAAPASSSSSSAESRTGGWVAQLRQGMPSAPTAAVLVATGGIAGFASGLLGVAPGMIVIPAVALAMPYEQATVLGTSLLAVVPPTAIALLQHHRLGNVDWRMAAGLAVGSVLGAAAGSQAAVHAPPGALEGVFTVALLALARATLRSVR